MKYPILIAGGGLAGLVCSIELAQAGLRVILIERKKYPHHKVCGEYVSNEVRPYLEKLRLDLKALGAVEIQRFRLTSPRGNVLDTRLDLGGFGISRYRLDAALYELALQAGVEVVLNTTITDIQWKADGFEVQTPEACYQAEIVVGAYGKRARLDRQLERPFMQQPSPYLGVKYHVRYDFPDDLIALHNFKGGYCGISAVEEGKFCFCYLIERAALKAFGSIPVMEKKVLARNPHLYSILHEAEFLYDKPEVINEISFAPKKAIENHILMAGDAAGLITPLCGNGMAMAIRAGSMAAHEITGYFNHHHNRAQLEEKYAQRWQNEFSTRLWVGRKIQRLFGSEALSEMALHFFGMVPPAMRLVIRRTHGSPF
ncbi:NAD(P)/FAD-dependent oxidoreductase [Rhabdobacter roseus]|uniref:Flavin-dependent dehydrogenase n=1 Tax=Rhabdobacter roseus TaxID=1655419 RepID=A0A840TU18_9BACT|nr:NAD(P)/FAD-dependent oxidoreductase [Rhabdobacter roseus]MBB5283538.1 flavin-dependent dehydrogenase [Rhabdobacter roseus]